MKTPKEADMGDAARKNLRKKNASQARQDHQKAVEKNLRLTLMNMRQLYTQETEAKIALTRSLDESRVFIAAVAIEYGDGDILISKESIERASLMDGVQLLPLDDDAGFSINVVEAPPEDDEAAVTESEDSNDEDLHEPV